MRFKIQNHTVGNENPIQYNHQLTSTQAGRGKTNCKHIFETREIAYMHLGDRASVTLILRTTKKSVHVEQG